jgi:hypothetical protein
MRHRAAFAAAQVKNLEAKLDAKHVKTRQVHDTSLNYVEGWHVIAEANRISATTRGTAKRCRPGAYGRAPHPGNTQRLIRQKSVSR